MADVTCVRCKQTRAPIPFKPFPNERGDRLLAEVCNICWGEWLKLQQQLINHYGLNLREQRAKDMLYAQLDQFLATSAPQS
ncbi:MAG: oxidative damage protection protein [Gemmatimonadetes bacterium]|nr:oxidative damage protection protein [Gemmatimonadota bacterium]